MVAGNLISPDDHVPSLGSSTVAPVIGGLAGPTKPVWPGSAWDGAPQLPAVAGGILTEHNVQTATVEGRMFDACPLEPFHEGGELVLDLHCDMRPSSRAMVRILAEVDLLPILALEPPGLACELRCKLGGR